MKHYRVTFPAEAIVEASSESDAIDTVVAGLDRLTGSDFGDGTTIDGVWLFGEDTTVSEEPDEEPDEDLRLGTYRVGA